MRIVVDAMGSDTNPVPDVEGAVMAAREWGDPIVLVGDRAAIERELAKHDTNGLKIEVVHASQVIEMTDKPAESLREKPDSSIHVGLKLVADGEADAFVTAGNTGVVLAVAMLSTLKRIRGVKRPALTAIFPSPTGQIVAADIGANADCKPENLVQFAIMASRYAELAMGIQSPRVGLLSNGEEEGKGNELVKETLPLMHAAEGINFIGNVEPKDVVQGATDIVIHDGFTGNVFIKTLEAATGMMKTLLKREITASTVTKLGGLLVKPAFGRVAKIVDPFEVGGAPLLGIDGVAIVGHGRSNALAIKNGVRQARRAVEGGVIEGIREAIGSNQG